MISFTSFESNLQSNNRQSKGRMRIQDKNKIKIKNSKLLNGGESTTINAISTIHDYVESGDLIGLQRLLARDPSLLNQRDNLVRSSSYFLSPPLLSPSMCVSFLAQIPTNLLFSICVSFLAQIISSLLFHFGYIGYKYM